MCALLVGALLVAAHVQAPVRFVPSAIFGKRKKKEESEGVGAMESMKEEEEEEEERDVC